MAVIFTEIKRQILIVLYDYMLTSDHEKFWFSISQIREGLSSDISGAFARRAIESLAEDGDIETGEGDSSGSSIYALTEQGIEEAEGALVAKGVVIDGYTPAPSADLIMIRTEEPDLHQQITTGLSQLAVEIRSSNSASAVLEDNKDIVLTELDAAVTISSKDRFRVARLIALILPTLRFIGDKFLGQGIGELAKQLADILVKMI